MTQSTEIPTRILPLLTWRSALCDSDLEPTTRHVALTLSLYMNERGGSAFPGASRMARDTGLAVSTVRTHLAALVESSWLVLVEKGGVKGERKTANHYQATIPPRLLAEVDPTGNPTGASAAPVGLTALTPPGNRADPTGNRTPSLQDLSKISPANDFSVSTSAPTPANSANIYERRKAVAASDKSRRLACRECEGTGLLENGLACFHGRVVPRDEREWVPTLGREQGVPRPPGVGVPTPANEEPVPPG